MRRTGLLVVVTLSMLAFTPAATGGTNPQTGESTGKTGEAPLNRGKGVTDVRYRCTDTLTAKSELSVTCDFINKSKTKGKRFIVCMMLDLKKGKQKPVPNIKQKDKKDYELRPNAKDPKKLECVEVNGSDGSDTSYHFGCQLVILKPGETKQVTFKGKSPYEAPPKMKVTANDFWINYADTINLDSKQDTTLDEKSCEAIIGQGQFLTPKVEGLSANWVVKEESFKDPVLGVQRTTVAAVSNLVYEVLGVVPCAPPAVPESTPPEGKCPEPSSRPPPPTKLDLNLYWFDSISSPHESYPAVLRVRIGGYSHGIRLVTSPAPGSRFVIPGGRRLYGSIMACAATPSTVCVPPAVPEGTRTTFEVDVLDAKTHGMLFSQFGTFIEDTQPPHVDSVALTPAAGGAFTIAVQATDATTSPIAATLWYSTDHGATWTPTGLQPTSDLLNSSHSRSFTGTFAPAGGAPATYYIVVADELDNEVWFGPGTTGPQFQLQVTKTGAGAGTVASVPPGIDCGAVCTITLSAGTTVTLTATPNSGSFFSGFSGACTGAAPCQLTMNGNKAVTAAFGVAAAESLSVTVEGDGLGTVTSQPAGISCPASCAAPFAAGTLVTLSAVPNPGSVFSGWGGDCATVTAPQCTVKMDQARGVTATFNSTLPPARHLHSGQARQVT